MGILKRLPVGIDSFEKLVSEEFYYVDKTGLISELLHNWGKVNLFTRPRRFGKSLNMSMLRAFFEIGSKKALFDGLAISKEKDLCEVYMGKFPVISISLKNVGGLTYEEAVAAMKNVIGTEALRFSFLAESPALSETEKNLYQGYIAVEEGCFQMPDDFLPASLYLLSMLLAKHYGRETILLIDEYEVPLDKAFEGGYYEKMVSLLMGMLGSALKTNPHLYFAVLTGCLRISKESIFMGLNNMKVLSVTDVRFDEYFGFTDEEVKKMLEYYGLAEHYETVKEWYDGYRFGNTDVYCPWDVISYCDQLRADPDAPPEDYWSNTSSNSIVRRFINKADRRTRDEIERLIAGEEIVKEIYQDLTYSELDKTIDHLWSILFTTGYLTYRGRSSRREYRLVIPNREIRELFIRNIREWFMESADADAPKLDAFCRAFGEGDAERIEKLLNGYLWNTISIRDTAVQKEYKENFYHGILLGLLRHEENWLVKSNAESGEGYGDILIEIPETRTGVVIELKYAENGRLEEACERALEQIGEKRYESRLIEDGMQSVIRYGIAFFRKYCKVMVIGEQRK